MSSLDDIFMINDTDEEDENEENTSFGHISSPPSSIKEEPAKPKIEIPEEKKEPVKSTQENKKEEKKPKESIADKPKEEEQTDPNPIQIQKGSLKSNESESSERRFNREVKKNSKIQKEKEDINFEISEVNSQVDYSDKIDQLRRMIEEENRQFENDFEDLKSKNSEKLAILKQNNLSKEQSLSSSYDLEYRNVIWTTTLHHLKRGCFSDNLGLLFQQAINDEQFQLEKELIELKQKNEEEIDYYRSKMPITGARKSRKKRININAMSPKEMARIIYDKFYTKLDIEDYDFNVMNKIDSLIRKVQNESQYLASNRFDLKHKPLNLEIPTPKIQKQYKRLKSPTMIQNEKNIRTLKKHQKACNNLQKTVKKTDKYIKEMQEKDWFQGIFPHVE